MTVGSSLDDPLRVVKHINSIFLIIYFTCQPASFPLDFLTPHVIVVGIQHGVL